MTCTCQQKELDQDTLDSFLELDDAMELEIDRRSRDHIRWLQRALSGVLRIRLNADGRLGPNTRAAIRRFQTRERLPVTGTPGPRTEAALRRRGASPPPEFKLDKTRVRHFVCDPQPLQDIRDNVSRAATNASLRRALETAARRAVTMGLTAARALERSPRSSATRRAFRDAFGRSDRFVPSFRQPTFTWRDSGELVALRLRRAVEQIDSGATRYHCNIRNSNCPGCKRHNSNPNNFGCVDPSSRQTRQSICLGYSFWRSALRGDDHAPSTLIHETLHSHFARFITHSAPAWSRLQNAYCYQKFFFETNGLPVPANVQRRCIHG